MLRDGKYAAWFRTPRGQGTGIVDLAEGRISGRDSFFTYGGSYRVDEQHFSAVLTVNRHADGPLSVFGPDEVEVKLSGVCNGLVASCSGTAKEAPDVKFEAKLPHAEAPTAPVGVAAAATTGMASASPVAPPARDVAIKDVNYYRERGMSAYHAGDLIIALANFDLAIDMDPGLPDSYINRGIVFHRMGDLKRALSDVAEAKRIENSNRPNATSRARAP